MKQYYKLIHIDTATPKAPDCAIMIIYTGGTLGMVFNEQQALVPFDFQNILDEVPSLKNFNLKISVASFNNLIDSSDVNPSHWDDIASLVEEYYDAYDGFIVIHGTDTMAYTASAISFMLEGLNKPVIFTGAQLPIGAARSDARENLITAIEIASQKLNQRPIVSEVCIYFDNLLLRANRAKKVESVQFDAFQSENYPVLAEAGIIIEYNFAALRPYQQDAELKVRKNIQQEVAILKVFPGISKALVEGVLSIDGLKGLVIETFGSGNAPTEKWFINALQKAINKGVLIMNVSQCMGGKVIQGRYQTSKDLQSIGVFSGSDITTEAAITKMMYVISHAKTKELQHNYLIKPLRGEME
ncbi:asparaginase [Marivirga arenosa]|uniref:asparaginase n=1 Tax=Marivirga arenosa TaxID=3059076 RepID=A0AA51N5V7_9BACT|nr:asparaginase [Marivirga sp. ABR2-2]WMN06692.1 asparaginase [Marivirga sp. ABR2-2]